MLCLINPFCSWMFPPYESTTKKQMFSAYFSLAVPLTLLPPTMFIVLYGSFLFWPGVYLRDALHVSTCRARQVALVVAASAVATRGVWYCMLRNNVQRQRNLHYGSIVNYAHSAHESRATVRRRHVPPALRTAARRLRKTKVLRSFHGQLHLKNEYLWVSIALH